MCFLCKKSLTCGCMTRDKKAFINAVGFSPSFFSSAGNLLCKLIWQWSQRDVWAVHHILTALQLYLQYGAPSQPVSLCFDIVSSLTVQPNGLHGGGWSCCLCPNMNVCSWLKRTGCTVAKRAQVLPPLYCLSSGMLRQHICHSAQLWRLCLQWQIWWAMTVSMSRLLQDVSVSCKSASEGGLVCAGKYE